MTIRLPAFLVAFISLAATAAPTTTDHLERFRELEAQGARIGAVRIDTHNIFDLSDPRESGTLFQLANTLHVRTRNDVIREMLLFKPGDRVSARVIEETERILRRSRWLYDVEIRPAAYNDGLVVIDVITRDTWTLDITGKVSRSGGKNTTSFGLKDENFFGTGATLGFSQVSDPDRHGWLFEASYPRAFGGWTRLAYTQGHFNDGSSKIGSIVRPFYALDTRWAAGLEGSDEDRIDPIYNAGDVVAKFRHRLKKGEAFGGWSPGLVNGWTHRYSFGATAHDDAYSLAPGEVAPIPFPVDHKVRGPFARYELVEDRFLRTRNRELIARPEFVAMGLNLSLQVTRSTESWGASQSEWLYSAKATRGFAFPWRHDAQAALVAERNIDSTGKPLSHEGVLLRYFGPQTPYAAFYGSIAGDWIGTAAAPDLLEIGGDTGLRGYPLRYQAGERRALLTLEQRVYTDWYPFRLVRVGGAAFFDAGRAWRGVNQNVENGGWLSDFGVGLRLSVDRAAFANVLHVDVAFPFDREPGIKAVQFVVKSKLTF
jgi:hypothetical protein